MFAKKRLSAAVVVGDPRVGKATTLLCNHWRLVLVVPPRQRFRGRGIGARHQGVLLYGVPQWDAMELCAEVYQGAYVVLLCNNVAERAKRRSIKTTL